VEELVADRPDVRPALWSRLPGPALGVGGVLHDFAAAVWADNRLACLVRAEDVGFGGHGVDVASMQRHFDEDAVPERVVGRWLLHLRASGVVPAVVTAALSKAGVRAADLVAVGHTCARTLLPPFVRNTGRPMLRVNHLFAHAAGVTEARAGDDVVVLDVIGDRTPLLGHEASSRFHVGAERLRRDWTVYEPSSLGVLLDGAAMLNGLAALDRVAAEQLFNAEDRGLLDDVSVRPDGYEFTGMRWREMVRAPTRQQYLVRTLGQGGTQAGQRFARAAYTLALTVGRSIVARPPEEGGEAWLAGDALLHRPLAAALTRDGGRVTHLPGDEGTAVGASRIAAAAVAGHPVADGLVADNTASRPPGTPGH
jgi:hypothetical protein